MREQPLPEHFESAHEDPQESFMMHLEWLRAAQLWSGILSTGYAAIFAIALPQLLTGRDEEGQRVTLGIPDWVFYVGLAGAFFNAASHFYAYAWLRSRKKMAPQKLRVASYYGLAAVWGLCFYPLHFAMGLLTLALLRKEHAEEWFNQD